MAPREDTHEPMRDDFVSSERGDIEIEGFGGKEIFFLENKLPAPN